MSESDKRQNNIRSLQEKRLEKNKRLRQQYLTPEQRILELEQEMVRVIDMCMELNETVNHQSKMIRIITRALQELSSTVVASAQARDPLEK